MQRQGGWGGPGAAHLPEASTGLAACASLGSITSSVMVRGSCRAGRAGQGGDERRPRRQAGKGLLQGPAAARACCCKGLLLQGPAAARACSKGLSCLQECVLRQCHGRGLWGVHACISASSHQHPKHAHHQHQHGHEGSQAAAAAPTPTCSCLCSDVSTSDACSSSTVPGGPYTWLD
jgi:hypothetical protein